MKEHTESTEPYAVNSIQELESVSSMIGNYYDELG